MNYQWTFTAGIQRIAFQDKEHRDIFANLHDHFFKESIVSWKHRRASGVANLPFRDSETIREVEYFCGRLMQLNILFPEFSFYCLTSDRDFRSEFIKKWAVLKERVKTVNNFSSKYQWRFDEQDVLLLPDFEYLSSTAKENFSKLTRKMPFNYILFKEGR